MPTLKWWLHPGINEEPRHRLGYNSPLNVSFRIFAWKMKNKLDIVVPQFTLAWNKYSEAIMQITKAIVYCDNKSYEVPIHELDPEDRQI